MKQNYIIISVAGSGKTTRLIKYVNDLLQDNIDKILLISYTNSTCSDLKQRTGINAMTFHSFALSLLSTKGTISTTLDNLINTVIDKYHNLKSKFTMEEIKSFIDLCKAYGGQNNIQMTDEEKIINEEIVNLTTEIENIKKNKKIFSFNDLVIELYNNLDEYLPEIFERYDYLCIDEAQDLSMMQLDIMKRIISSVFLEEDKGFLIVGDPEQSIYDFNVSSYEIYMSFLKEIEILTYKSGKQLCIEHQNKTYRFGGEIIKMINSKFNIHASDIKTGILVHYEISEAKLITKLEDIILELLATYLIEDIMIIFQYNNTLIHKIQNDLNLGFSTKLWLKNNIIYTSLEDIYYYLLTKSEYYAARILQGVFYHISEPEFYLRSNYTQHPFIKEINNTSLKQLMNFLYRQIIHTNIINTLLFMEIYRHSFAYISFSSFFLSLPDQIEITQPGLSFSTIHSAKGLEKKCVIFLDFQKIRQKNYYINYNPFYILNKKSIIQTSKSLNYVALTRAKEKLIHIEILDKLL